MTESLRDSLNAAAEAGLIAPAQAGPLAAFLDARRGDDAAAPVSADDAPNLEEDSEVPRFIRGYHDVLITIGIVIVLVGLGGLATVFAAAAATIVLAEIFVRRQRLALPSFALTIAFAICIGFMLVFFDEEITGATAGAFTDSAFHLARFAALECAALGLFYWRYRVPVAMAVLLVTGVVTVMALVLAALYTGNFSDYGDMLLLISGLVLIAIAIRLDFTDPQRITRRSDIAFWLYLVAVPATLRGIFNLVAPETSAGASAIVGIVIIMMLVGLLLDRRAFVTAGLIYLGFAFATLLTQNRGFFAALEGSDKVLWILLAIGIIVLSVGFGWRFLRRQILGAMPPEFRTLLPVIR